MVFSSLTFIFMFLPLTILIYYSVPKVLKNFILLVASLIFYSWGEPVYILLMIFTIIVNYLATLLIDHIKDKKGLSQVLLIGTIVFDLGILSFFKYYGFLVENINALLGLNITVSTLPLPLGISFYTFQTLSYVIDVYLSKVPVQRNIIAFGTYITMFPQLVAGPIVKYSHVFKQLRSRKESVGLFGEGVEQFISGLAKKVILANNIGLLWQSVKATPFGELSILAAWLGIVAFMFQIYFDFSGYSDMALGLGKMFGFNLTKNFDYPYIARSVTEFWRRWHITLGLWFREYVYIPLGGNRKGGLKQYRNLFVVWFLTGLWHGASWNFVIWGLYFGIFVVLEKIFLLKWFAEKPPFIGHIYTLFVILVGWVFFEFEQLSLVVSFLGIMFGFGSKVLFDSQALYYLYTNGVLFLLLALCSTPFVRQLVAKVQDRFGLGGYICINLGYLFLLFISTAYMVNESYNPFLYFRF